MDGSEAFGGDRANGSWCQTVTIACGQMPLVLAQLSQAGVATGCIISAPLGCCSPISSGVVALRWKEQSRGTSSTAWCWMSSPQELPK